MNCFESAIKLQPTNQTD